MRDDIEIKLFNFLSWILSDIVLTVEIYETKEDKEIFIERGIKYIMEIQTKCPVPKIIERSEVKLNFSNDFYYFSKLDFLKYIKYENLNLPRFTSCLIHDIINNKVNTTE